MNNNKNLLKKFETGTQTWADYKEILSLDIKDL